VSPVLPQPVVLTDSAQRASSGAAVGERALERDAQRRDVHVFQMSTREIQSERVARTPAARRCPNALRVDMSNARPVTFHSSSNRRNRSSGGWVLNLVSGSGDGISATPVRDGVSLKLASNLREARRCRHEPDSERTSVARRRKRVRGPGRSPLAQTSAASEPPRRRHRDEFITGARQVPRQQKKARVVASITSLEVVS
jgi:hypothetical protein